MQNNRRGRSLFRPAHPLRERSQRGFYRNVRALSLFRRLDPIIIAVAALILLLIIVAWLLYQFFGIRAGWFDRPPLRLISDDRRLVNVRTELDQNPLLDAVYHPPDAHVYIAQQGGMIHRYDPLTGIWDSQNLTTDGAPIDGNFIQLSSGCGSYLEINPSCADNDSVWAWTEGGGLAQFSGGRWTTVFTTSAFVGTVSGKTVDQTELVTAAISAAPESRWLVLGTRANGIGIYDSLNRIWLDPATFRGSLASSEITQLVWWRDRFWAGSRAGLSSIQVNEQGVEITSYADESGAQVNGEIIDLDAAPIGEPDSGLWILEQRGCMAQSADCLRLSRIESPSADPAILIDEQNRYQDIDLSRFDFAQAVGDYLVFSGVGGVYSYNNRLHSWNQISPNRVTAVLPTSDNTGFYYGYNGGAGLVQNAEYVTEWDIPAGEVEKLMFGGQNEVLALTLSSSTQNIQLYSIPTNGAESESVYVLDETLINPAAFRTALASGDWVLFVTEVEGALLHNVRTREYREINARLLPIWLTNASLIINLPSGVFVVSMDSNRTAQIYFIDSTQLYDVNFYGNSGIGSLAPVANRIAAPVAQVWTWDAASIGIIDTNGGVMRVSAQGVDQQIGNAEPRLTRDTPTDLVSLDQSLVFSMGRELLQYDLTEREWTTFATPALPTGESLVELVNVNGTILTRTNDNRLITQTGTTVIGGADRFAMTDAQISDAWLVDQHLFVAGDGAVDRYDFDQRAISQTWSVGVGDVQLSRIINDTPLALVGSDAYFGGRRLNDSSETVLSLSYDGTRLWTTRENSSNRFLAGQTVSGDSISSNTVCFFRQPYADGAARILDARRWSTGVIAAATDAGLRLYSPTARTWYSVPTTLIEPDRVYLVGDRLLLVDDRTADQELVFINGITLPDSCSTSPAAVQVETSTTVQAHTVDEVNGRVALLDSDGTVREWQAGRINTLLEASPVVPPSTALQRVFERPGYVLFSTGSELWRYNLDLREWQEIAIQLAGSAAALVEMNVEYVDGANIITVTAADGSIYVGTFGDADIRADLSRAYRPTTPVSGGFAVPLVDVQQRATMWAFLFQDQVRYFDPRSRTWTEGDRFSGNPAQQFVQIGRFGVILAAQNWHVATTVGETPRTFAPYTPDPSDQQVYLDSAGDIWRFTAASEILRCDQTSGYACETQFSPFVIDPSAMTHALTWGERVLFVSDDGVRVYDERTRSELDVPALGTLTDITAIHRTEQNLFLYSATSAIIAVLDAQGRVMMLDAVQAVVFSEDERFYIQKADVWYDLTSGSLTAIDPVLEPFAAEAVTPQPYPLDDDWANLQTEMVTLADGRSAYRPVTMFTLVDDALMAVYSTGDQTRLANEAYSTVQPTLPDALDAGWLRWERNQGEFSVATVSGRTTYAPANFFAGDQLLFEPIAALLSVGATTTLAANTAGLWEYHQTDLALDDVNIVFYPASLTAPITAVHGRFLTGDEQVTATQRGAITNLEFSIGAVTFREELAAGTVSATVTINGVGAQGALLDSGFLWDEDRRGLAYSDTALLLQSAAGVQPITAQLTSFDAEPNSIALNTGQLLSSSMGGIYLYVPTSGAWFERVNGVWQTSTDPADNRTLVNDSIWTWQISGGLLSINLNGTAFDFARTPNRVGFTSDQLRSAAALDNQLLVVTDAFFEITVNADGLRNYAAPRFTSITTDRFETYNDAAVGVGLYNRFNGALTGRWNSAATRFEQVGANPTQQRTLVDTPRIQLTLNSGQISKELRLDAFDNRASSWATFQLDNGRFPFDVINSVDFFDNQLYAGSNAGLQVYSSASGSFQNINQFYDFRASGSNPDAVLRVGSPENSPDLFMARGSAVCAERTLQNPTLSVCADSSRLDTRVRLSTDFWYWVEANTVLTGYYRLADNRLDPSVVDYSSGRLPHDRIYAAAICDNRVYTLWTDGALSVSGDFTLNGAISNYRLPDETPKSLICVTAPIVSAQRTILAQLYLVTAQGNLWTNTGSIWQPFTDASATQDIFDYAANPTLYANNRLRYRQGNLGTLNAFEYQRLDQDWVPFEWVVNPVSNLWSQNADRWQHAEPIQGSLWVATEAGIIAVQRPNSTSINLDPASLVVVDPPQPPLGCPITEMRADAAQVTVRCNSDSANVYSGVLDGTRSDSVFAPRSDDPFAAALYVNSYWTINMSGNEAGRRGSLSARLDNEDTQIVGGRFEHDMIDSLELFHGALVEIASTAAGWYQSPTDDLSVEALFRNRLVAALPQLESVRRGFGDTEALLCLRTIDSQYVRLIVNAQRELEIRDSADSCPAYLGDQTIWRYRTDGQQLEVIAPLAIGNLGQRILSAGRFTDDIAAGLPIARMEVLDETSNVEEIAIYMPTQAGIVVLDVSHRLRRLYLPREGIRLVIQIMDDGTLAYWGGDGLYTLNDSTLIGTAVNVPANFELLALQNGDGDLFRLRWEDQTTRGWSLFSTNENTRFDNGYSINVSNFWSYQQNLQRWEQPLPQVIVIYQPEQIRIQFAQEQAEYTLASDFRLVEAINRFDQIFLIGNNELIQLDINDFLQSVR